MTAYKACASGAGHHPSSKSAAIVNHAQRFTQLAKSTSCSSCSATIPATLLDELDLISHGLACGRGDNGCSLARHTSFAPGSAECCRVSDAQAWSARLQRRRTTGVNLSRCFFCVPGSRAQPGAVTEISYQRTLYAVNSLCMRTGRRAHTAPARLSQRTCEPA